MEDDPEDFNLVGLIEDEAQEDERLAREATYEGFIALLEEEVADLNLDQEEEQKEEEVEMIDTSARPPI